MTSPAPLPTALREIVDDFEALAGQEKLQLLLEFAENLPALPARYADHPELLEPVPECQSPVFLITEVDSSVDPPVARLFFTAPPEAPTTRGFAGILREGLDGRPVDEVLSTSADFAMQLPLADVVSPLRLRGLSAMLARVKRQLAQARQDATDDSASDSSTSGQASSTLDT
jgi:cysteine desulfuration protein SufE